MGLNRAQLQGQLQAGATDWSKGDGQGCAIDRQEVGQAPAADGPIQAARR